MRGLGAGGCGGKRPVLAVMLIIAPPQRLQHRQHLLHHGHAEVHLHAARHAVEFALIGALAEAEFEPSAREQIEQRRLAGELDRVPVGRHHDRGAEADARGVRGEVGEQLERAGRDGHLDGVMLGGPDDIETALVRHLHHLGDVAHDLAQILVGAHALQIDDEIKSHRLGPSLLRGSSGENHARVTAKRRPVSGQKAGQEPTPVSTLAKLCRIARGETPCPS